MSTRLISATASEISKMTKEELLTSIKASEGRVVLSENVVMHEPVEDGITISEMTKAAGADMILLNAFDTLNPIILGMPDQENIQNAIPRDSVVKELKEYVGRPLGLNLEPIDLKAEMLETRLEISKGRQANEETLKRAKELGFDFVCLTANPGVGTSNKAITHAIELAKKYLVVLLSLVKCIKPAVTNQSLQNKQLRIIFKLELISFYFLPLALSGVLEEKI